MKTKTDESLIAIVHTEMHGPYEICAMLSRFGGLAVHVIDHKADAHRRFFAWQGDNVLAARARVEELLASLEAA